MNDIAGLACAVDDAGLSFGRGDLMQTDPGFNVLAASHCSANGPASMLAKGNACTCVLIWTFVVNGFGMRIRGTMSVFGRKSMNMVELHGLLSFKQRGVTCCLVLLFLLWPLASIAQVSAETAALPGSVETLVFVRHAEKPAGGYGQLNCRGLNRSLALPHVLFSKFGKPDYIFAPDPAHAKHEPAGVYDYVRPLATIEPTAIAAGLPVNTHFGFKEITALKAELVQPQYRGATIFIAWEHALIEEIVRELISASSNSADVPHWDWDDFDSIYVLRLDNRGTTPIYRFEVLHEGLNDMATQCP